MNHSYQAIACAFSLACGLMFAEPTVAARGAEVQLFPLIDVTLLEGPFLHAAQLNRDHLLRYDPDRLLAPYLMEAGLDAKAAKYPNWESIGLEGHTAGHYLSALASSYAALGDSECLRRLDYMVSELARCQEAHGDGYVGGVPRGRALWEQVAAAKGAATGFSLDNRWVPFYNLHKTFAGLRDAYQVAGNRQAKEVLIRLADWCGNLVASLDDEQLQQILHTEHGGMNEVLADVSAITGDSKYLALAKRFSHQAILQPLIAQEDRLDGLHANTQVPKVTGFQRIGSLGDDKDYRSAAKFFWHRVVEDRSLSFGGNSISEHFPSAGQSIRWIESREGPETCNTYNMLRLTEQLFAEEPRGRYVDYYERALFNHILSTQHPEHGGYVYFTPARPRHYRVYSQPEQAFWCCVGTGMENHAKYGQFIYAHDAHGLYVNLFIASQVAWRDGQVRLTQQTQFPDLAATQLKLDLKAPAEFTLHIRHPEWVRGDAFRVLVNGEPVASRSEPGSFLRVTRMWHNGDVIDVALPMELHVDALPHLDDYVALRVGPIVLAAKTDAQELTGLLASTGRMDQVAAGPLRPLNEAPMLVCEPSELVEMIEPVEGEALTFTLARAIQPDPYDALRLIPLFRLHDARYMLYWRRVAPDQYAAWLNRLKEDEQAKIALDLATLDRVAPGEQQAETEHHFQGEDTSTGIWQDRRFRHGAGWFSYDLQARGEQDVMLQVTYFGSDRRRFKILINGTELTRVDLDAPRPNEFLDVTYPIPKSLMDSDADRALTVRFQAESGSMAGGIFDVRLLRRTAP